MRLVDSASKVPGLQCCSIGLCSTRWSGISGWESVGKTTGISFTERLMSTGGCFMAKSVICPESIDSSGSIVQRRGSLSNCLMLVSGLYSPAGPYAQFRLAYFLLRVCILQLQCDASSSWLPAHESAWSGSSEFSGEDSFWFVCVLGSSWAGSSGSGEGSGV